MYMWEGNYVSSSMVGLGFLLFLGHAGLRCVQNKRRQFTIVGGRWGYFVV